MTITEQQRIERLKYVGSSDAGAILGLNPWKTATDVYNERVYELQPEASQAVRWGKMPPMESGNWMEPILVQLVELETGHKIQPDVHRVGENQVMACNMDGRAEDPSVPIAVEAKVTTLRDKYGAHGTGEVPESVACQAQHIMYCDPSVERVIVPVAFVRYGIERAYFVVERDDVIIDHLRRQCEAFMFDHVRCKTPPPEGGMPNAEILKRIRREEGKRVMIDSSLFRVREQTQKEMRAAISKDDYYKYQLIQLLGDAEVGEMPDLRREITYFEQSRRSYGVGDKYEEVCDSCGVGVKHSKHRVLRERKM